MEVLVVGAGVAGLTLAIGLKQHGVKVTVVERAADLGPVGNGIQIPPNACKVLRRLGVYDQLYEYAGGEGVYGRWIDYKTGGEMLKKEYTDWPERFGAPYLFIHRKDYIEILRRAAKKHGIPLLLGRAVEKVDLDGPSITLANGEIMTADVLVGCDGIHSRIRTTMHPSIKSFQATGAYAYRFVVPISAYSQPDCSDALKQAVSVPSSLMWFGHNSHVVFYPTRHLKEYNLVLCIVDEPVTKRINDCPDEQSKMTELRRYVSDWEPLFREMLDRATGVATFPMLEVGLLPYWNKGRTTVMGDAAHATTPYLASGAAMAIEDGLVLSTLLGRFAQRHECALKSASRETFLDTHLPTIFQSLQDLQKERTGRVVTSSQYQGTYNIASEGSEMWKTRAEEARTFDMHTTKSKAPWVDAESINWLMGRDAGEAVDNEWERLVATGAFKPVETSESEEDSEKEETSSHRQEKPVATATSQEKASVVSRVVKIMRSCWN